MYFNKKTNNEENMKKAILAASIALMATSAHAQIKPYEVSRSANNHFKPVKEANRDGNIAFTLEVSNSDLESTMALDMGVGDNNYVITDPMTNEKVRISAKPSEVYNFETTGIKTLKVGLGKEWDRHSVIASYQLSMPQEEGTMNSESFYTNQYATDILGGADTFYAGVSSELDGYWGQRLSVTHKYKMKDDSRLHLSLRHTLNVVNDNYTFNGATITQNGISEDGLGNHFGTAAVGDDLQSYGENYMDHESLFVTYNLGLEAKLNVTRNIYLSGKMGVTPLGAYMGEVDLYNGTVGRTEYTSARSNTYLVTGYDYEIKAGFDLPSRKNSSVLGIYVKAYYEDMTAHGVAEMGKLQSDFKNQTIDSHESTRQQTGVAAGFNYSF